MTLKNVLGNSGYGCWLLNYENIILDVNTALTGVLGYLPGQMVGKPTVDFLDAENTRLFIDKLYDLAPNQTAGFFMQMLAKNGDNIEVNVTGSVVTDNEGENLYYLCLIEDLAPIRTEKKRSYWFEEIKVNS